MKKIYFIITTILLVLTTLSHAEWLDNVLKGKTASRNGPDNTTVISGLKEALSRLFQSENTP